MIGATTIEWLAKTCIWTTLILRCVKMNSSCDGSRVIPINILICMEMICDQRADKFSVESGQSTLHFLIRQQIVDFPCKFLFSFCFQGRGQSKEFPITPHFYFMWFGKCCPPFTYIGGPKRRPLYFKIEPFILGSLHCFFFFFGVMGRLAHCKNKTKKTWEASYLMNRKG